MLLPLFTVGHSTHALDKFLALLAQHEIAVLVDIRRFPGSRKYPHFHQSTISDALAAAGMDYVWIEALGGRRPKARHPSPHNLGLRNASFRNYADYMATAEFQAGIEQLLAQAEQKRTAYMCSESVYWRCHRRLVSDYLVAKGIPVQHIMPSGDLRPHTLTTGVKFIDGQLTYPPERDQGPRLFD